MPVLTIDGRTVEVPKGATVLDAATRAGVEIPTLCYHPGLKPQTSCLVCVVRVNGGRGLVPACATEAIDGMRVESETQEVHAARRTALELLVGDHLGDCLGPCQTVCPAQIDIPRMIRFIASGQFAEAVTVVRDRVPFPSVLGRVCPALCERGCRRRDVDAAVAIRLLERFVGDYDLASLTPYAPECSPATGKKVAIVGGGPAGLSAAYFLLRAGHACTLFDEHDKLGGGLRHGVPGTDLPRSVLDAEIASVVRLGLEVRSGTHVGTDVSVSTLREEFDALVVAIGESGSEGVGLPVVSGQIQADRRTQATPLEGVFAAGSAISPSRYAVRAVASGRNAAEAVCQYLAGERIVGVPKLFNVRLGRADPHHLARLAAEASPESRVSPGSGPSEGYVAEEASREAERCLGCDCTGLDTCRLRYWAARYGADPERHREGKRAFQREATHPNLVYESGKCIACGLCVQIASEAAEEIGLTYIGRGFSVRVGAPFGEPLANALRKAALACAEVCPTGALTIARRERIGQTASDV